MKTPDLLKMLQTDKWVRPFLRQYRGALLLALLLGFLTFFCAGALMFTSGYLISRAAEMPGNVMLIYVPIVLTRAFGIGRPVLHYAERLTSHNWVLRMTSSLRLKLYNTLETDAIFFRDKHRMGEVLGLLAEDIGHIQNLYLRTVFPTAIAWLVYAFWVICLSLFSIWFALAMLLMLGILVFLFPLVSVLANGARQSRRGQMKNRLYEELTDNVLGVEDWLIAGRGDDYLSRYHAAEAEQNNLDTALDRYDRRRDLVMQVVFGVIAVLLLLWAGMRFPGIHSGEANWIAAFTLCFFPLIDAFAALPAAAQETNIYAGSMERMNALSAGEKEEPAPPPDLGEPITIRVENVSFRYEGAKHNVLDGLSLSIRPGEKLALLGRSGIGKSTLAALIRGDLRPHTGLVTLNETPAFQLGESVTRYIGVIQQKPYIFNTTLLNNLRIGRRDATEAESWSALEKVGLAEMTRRLPEGLHTVVGEAGLRFSGGERQRLALARVLLTNVAVILLDEPTVGLDPVTEHTVLKTFFQNLTDRTVIWITHHLQGVRMMDRVVFMADGKLAMDGSPDELMQSNAHFRELYSLDQGIVINE